MTDRQLGMDLLREWDEHNHRHVCYYESAEYDGMAECPSMYATLGDFLGASGFPVETLFGRFFGRDLSEPNFRSRNSGMEFPVADEPVSVAERRRRGNLRANKGIHYRETTDEVLRNRAEKAAEAPSENGEEHWEVRAMRYFHDRLDGQDQALLSHNSMVMGELAGIKKLLMRLDENVCILMDKSTERSEVGVAVEPKVVVTLENVPADVAEELQAELSKRLERLMRLREAKAGR